MIQAYEKFKAPAIVGLKHVDNPKLYGLAYGKKISKNLFKLIKVVEKPTTSVSKLGLSGVNIFESEIYEAAKITKKSVRGEIELTDCVQTMIKNKKTVIGHKLNSKEICIDMGTPTNYFKALEHSYRHIKT